MNTKDSSNLTKRYKQILSAVHIVYRLVNSTPNLKELSLRLTRLVCQFIQASSATIYLLTPDRRKVCLSAAFNNQINILQMKKRDLSKIPSKDFSVAQGASIFEPRMMGMPLVTEECIGAIIIRRASFQPQFDAFDREMFTIFAEQSVTAIRNLQFSEEQQRVILESMKFISKILAKQDAMHMSHSPAFFRIVEAVAKKFRMNSSGVNNLYYASILHNAGAINVPYQFLSKKSQLSRDEFRLIRDLPKQSAELIRPIAFLKPVLPIVLYLHEHYDGSGYPSGLKAEQIPLGARIMAVAHAFESMVQGRPYKKSLSIAAALKELKSHSGAQFDPVVVDVFLKLAQTTNFRNCLSSISKET